MNEKDLHRLLYSNKFVAMVMLLMQIITFVAMYIWISDYSKVLFGLSTVLSAVLIIFEINRTEESTFKMTWITLYCDYTYIRCFVLSVYKGTGSVNEYR